jgi:hypothetical protein
MPYRIKHFNGGMPGSSGFCWNHHHAVRFSIRFASIRWQNCEMEPFFPRVGMRWFAGRAGAVDEPPQRSGAAGSARCAGGGQRGAGGVAKGGAFIVCSRVPRQSAAPRGRAESSEARRAFVGVGCLKNVGREIRAFRSAFMIPLRSRRDGGCRMRFSGIGAGVGGGCPVFRVSGFLWRVGAFGFDGQKKSGESGGSPRPDYLSEGAGRMRSGIEKIVTPWRKGASCGLKGSWNCSDEHRKRE